MKPAVLLKDRGILAVGGPECRTFLQNLVSNDIDRLTAEHALYAALLTPQGKYLFDFLMVEHDDGILLDTGRERLPELLRKLIMYRMRAHVTLHDVSEQWTVAALLDRPAGLAATAGACTSRDGAILFTDPREPLLGARALLPAGQSLESLGYEPAEPTAYEIRRISLCVPDGGRDLVVDKTLLLEADFERLGGVSFTKGCYVGQELTARTKHRGNVRRKFYPVRLDDPVQPGMDVMLEGRPIGDIRSVAGNNAIACLRIEDVRRARKEGLLIMAGTGALQIEEPALE